NARRSGQATRITGVADGVEDSDAVNRGQLNTVRNDLQALDQVAVKYTDNSRTAISLGDGSGAVRMSNVAAGVTATDAVNKGQLDAVAADLGAVASDALMYDGQAYNATRGGQATRITGVAAGTNRTDATNFGQLDAVASIFGAGGRWANGSYVAPTFVIGGQTFTTVGDAFAAVDGRLAGIEDRVTDVEERPTSTRGVTYDDESRDAVTLEGKSGTRVSNVADGKADTDAANVRQVKKAESNSKAYTDTKTTETLQTAKRYTDTRVNDVSRGLDELGNRMERGFRETNKRISRQSAMTSAMVQMGINAAGGRSERGRIAFGLGYSDGEAAVSVGYGKSFGRGSVSVGGAFSGGEASVGVGFGFDM
ncbi:YadA-like family protein, partial [Salmonella enterica]|nr:YadA-like family protein [Salmonella enterica]